jgi:hypothetical protein
MLVFYEEKTGIVRGLGPKPREGFNHIEVDKKDVIDLILGKEMRRNYRVDYNPKTKELELRHVHDTDFFNKDIQDYLYEIPSTDIVDPDITVIQDMPNKCWKFLLGTDLKTNLNKKKAKLRGVDLFSITKKHDPNILYKSLFVDLTRTLHDNYFIIPFDAEFETQDLDFSIYTLRKFDSYQYKRVFNE